MPEAADVEGHRRTFARFATGRRVVAVRALQPAVLRNTSPQGLGRALAGRRLGEPVRHGKWLIVPVDGRRLVLHFGMTGSLAWRGRKAPAADHDAVVLRTDRGELHYRSQRKLGGVWLVRRGERVEDVTGALGPDAADTGRDEFLERVEERRGGIKATLMNQEFVAGLGNELSDEILWRARVDPRAAVQRLARRQRVAVYEAMKDVLAGSFRRGRVPQEEGWLQGRRDAAAPACPRCGRALARAKVAGRTALFCRRCQRGAAG